MKNSIILKSIVLGGLIAGMALFALSCMNDQVNPKQEKHEEEIIMQGTTTKTGDDDIFTVVEEMPFPKQGYDEFYKFLSNEIKYPSEAREQGISGKVYVQFVVNKDGSLSNIEVVKGIGGGCDEEAARALSKSTKWTPGSQRGREVSVRMILPINFKLD
jgi:periplasmic protein TonB